MKSFLISITWGIAGIGIFLYQQKPLSVSIEDGAEIYKDFCVQCHQFDGKGVQGSFPPLANSDYLFEDVDRSIRALKYGLKGPIVVNGESYNTNMSSQGLDDEEIADVMNYILRNWGNKSDLIITPEKVSNLK